MGELPAEITLLAGAPLHIALDGFDADGDSLTYSTNSTDSGLSAIIPKQVVMGGNRSLRITVSRHLGTDTPDDTSDDEVVPFGTMEFELFEGRASRATSRIIDLAESGWYDGKLFHRVISDFMIQGGSSDGSGQSGTGEEFDDQFHPTLQHTSEGLLSMAKTRYDDTNDSQFFITNTDPRWLDFNHTVFGLLTAGDDVRQAIKEVPTDGPPDYDDYGVNHGGNDRPLNDVVIESVEVFYDREDAVMMLAAPEGSSGDADVTVTVDDGNGGTAQRTIHVFVEPDTANGNPYLEDIDPIWLDFDTPGTFSLAAVDVEGDQIFFAGEAYPATNDLEVLVSSAGQVMITPKNGEFGAYTVAFDVGPASDNMQDSQIVPVFVRPPAPTIELGPLSDTGDQDDVTAVNNGEHNLQFVVSGVAFDATAWLEADGVEVATDEVSRSLADDGSGTYDVLLELTGDELADGVYEYRAGQTVALIGTYDGVDLTSDPSGLLSVTIDTSDPGIFSDPVLFVDAGEEYRYQVQATDGDNTDIRYEVQTPYPGMQQDPETGVITWTPDVNQAGIRPLVLFAIDGAGNTGRQEFDIEVNASLQIWIEDEDGIVPAEETTLSFLVKAGDKDDDDVPVDISVHDTTLPDGAEYSLTMGEDNTATFQWAIREEDGPGEYKVTFRAGYAEDDAAPGKYETFTITVTEDNVPPELTVAHQGWTPGDWLSIAEDEALLLDIAATDSDLPAQNLIFSLAGNVPDGASFYSDTDDNWKFAWTPGEQDGGSNWDMIFQVSDGEFSDEVTVNIAVEEVNSPPVFDLVEAQTTYEGFDFEVEVTARDPDVPANTIRYSLVDGEYPEGATIGIYSGKITWEVPRGFLEEHAPDESVTITVEAKDEPGGLSALTTVKVTVYSLEGLLAGAALMNAAQNDPFLPVPDASPDLSMFSRTPSGESAGTPSVDTLDLRSYGSSLFEPLFGYGGSSDGGSGQETKTEDESEKEEKDESDEKKDSDENKPEMSEGAGIIVPFDVVSSEFSDAAIEEYLDNQESTGESGRQADQASESSADGEQVAAEDEAVRVYVEELVAALAENETAGS